MPADKNFDDYATLLHENERLRGALEKSISALVVVDNTGNIKFVNKNWANLHRYDQIELLGKNLDIFSKDPKAYKQWFQKAIELVKSGDGFTGDQVHFTKDNQKRHLWIKIFKGIPNQQNQLEFTIAANDITLQKDIEIQLKENEDRYRNLIETMGDGLVVHNKDGEIIECNSAAQEILGLNEDQIKGKTPTDPQWKTIHEDGSEYPGMEHPASITLQTAQPIRNEIMGVHKSNNSLTWISINCRPITDKEGQIEKVVVTFHDITKEKEAQLKVKNSQSVLRQFVKFTPAAVAMFDTEMRYIMASDKWYSDYKIEGQDIIGKTHYEIFPEINQEWKEIHQRCLEGATEKRDADKFTREDGSDQWLEWEIRPWRNENNQVGGIIMFTNVITESIQQQHELEAKNIDLENLNRLMIDREVKMVELKKEIKKLKKELTTTTLQTQS